MNRVSHSNTELIHVQMLKAKYHGTMGQWNIQRHVFNASSTFFIRSTIILFSPQIFFSLGGNFIIFMVQFLQI